MSVIIPGRLLLGGVDESFDRAVLSRNRVTHVLNVASELDNIKTRVGLVYAMCGVPDDCPVSDMRSILSPSMDFLDAALRETGACVLVHCLEGVSRSVCVVLAYLVTTQVFADPDAALYHLQRCRPQVDPNAAILEGGHHLIFIMQE
jgi:protein-tyrosine phosphatase